MEDVEPAYNNSHRAFLQAFLARSVMTFEEAQPILASILSIRDGNTHHCRTSSCPMAHIPTHHSVRNPLTTPPPPPPETRPITTADITEADFHTYIATLNASLSPLDLEIRSTAPQVAIAAGDRHAAPPRVYALVNTTSDALTQLATTHTPDEIAFVKRLLDAMFETHNTRRAEVLALTTMQAVNLHKAPPRSRESLGGETQATQGGEIASLTMAQAQKVVDDLVDEGWFEKSRRGFLSLSPRALMELRGWLLETYNELPAAGEEDESEDEGRERVRVKMCEMCRDIVTVVSAFLVWRVED